MFELSHVTDVPRPGILCLGQFSEIYQQLVACSTMIAKVRAMLVDQLVDLSLPAPEIRGSYPYIGKFFLYQLYYIKDDK